MFFWRIVGFVVFLWFEVEFLLEKVIFIRIFIGLLYFDKYFKGKEGIKISFFWRWFVVLY